MYTDHTLLRDTSEEVSKGRCCSPPRESLGAWRCSRGGLPGGPDTGWLADTGVCLFCLSGKGHHNRQERGHFPGSETEVGVTLQLSSRSCGFRKNGVKST